MSDNNNMEAAALLNIANPYKTPQSLELFIVKNSLAIMLLLMKQ